MDAQDPRLVTLGTMRDGAVEELFQTALRAVLDNIDDPNTEHKAKRRVTLTFTLTATDDTRQDVAIEAASSVKLAGVRPVSALVHVTRSGGKKGLREPLRQESIPLSGPQGVVRGEGGGR